MAGGEDSVLAEALQVGAGALAALGAWYAMKAAKASQATSRDAAKALALHVRPDVQTSFQAYRNFGERDDPRNIDAVILQVQAATGNDASDVVIELVRRDGARQTFRTEMLLGWTEQRASQPGANLAFEQRLDPNPTLDNYLVHDLYESVAVSFSDTQDLARWSRRYRVRTRSERSDLWDVHPVIDETGLVQVR